MATSKSEPYQVLDLFSGLGGFSSAFEDSDQWKVTTVDIESKFDPDIVANVFDLKPSDFNTDFDVVLVSVPCTQFSFACSSLERIVNGEPQTEDAQDAVALAYHAIGLARGLNPDYWFLENPQGYLRQVIGRPKERITYCQYGTDYMKPTDLWGDHPAAFRGRSCSHGDDCHARNRDQAHGGKGNCDVIGDTAEERSLVPYELSEAIRDACVAGLRGETPEQSTLPTA